MNTSTEIKLHVGDAYEAYLRQLAKFYQLSNLAIEILLYASDLIEQNGLVLADASPERFTFTLTEADRVKIAESNNVKERSVYVAIQQLERASFIVRLKNERYAFNTAILQPRRKPDPEEGIEYEFTVKIIEPPIFL